MSDSCGLMDWSLPGSSVHGFPRQEYWIGLPFPPPGALLLDPGIKPASPALTDELFITEPPGKPLPMHYFFSKKGNI